MAKNKNLDPSDAEDYLSRVKWKSDYAYRRTPWYLIPKWKYKPVSPYKKERPDSAFLQVVVVTLFVIPVGLILYAFFNGHIWEALGIFALYPSSGQFYFSPSATRRKN